MPFQFHPLNCRIFAPLFGLSDVELREKGSMRVIADENPGFPCRVSLEDAAPGEEVILTNHKHLDMPSPYAAAHAIYVRKGVEEARLAPGQIPASLHGRTLSVRAFDEDGLMRSGDLAEAGEVAGLLEKAFADPKNAFVDIHFAQRGCFAARAKRN